MIRFAFFGSDAIAIPVLNALETRGLIPALVICSPDAPKGRGLTLTPPPAKEWALQRNIPVLQPKNIRKDISTFLNELNAHGPFDVFIVASYGKIIPEEIFSLPAHGTLNVHPSLLPKLRGPAPLQGTILTENTAGVTIIELDKEVDHGPIIAQKEVAMAEWPPRYSNLETALGYDGGWLLAENMHNWVNGKVTPREQDHAQATFTKKITKEDALIELSGDAEANLRKIRAYEEWPGAYFFYETPKGPMRIKANAAHIENDTLVLDRVTPEGRKEMGWQDFLRGVQK